MHSVDGWALGVWQLSSVRLSIVFSAFTFLPQNGEETIANGPKVCVNG